MTSAGVPRPTSTKVTISQRIGAMCVRRSSATMMPMSTASTKEARVSCRGLERGPEELRYPFGQVLDQESHQRARFSRFSSREVRCDIGMLTAR